VDLFWVVSAAVLPAAYRTEGRARVATPKGELHREQPQDEPEFLRSCIRISSRLVSAKASKVRNT
jgi:hypothetical protein